MTVCVGVWKWESGFLFAVAGHICSHRTALHRTGFPSSQEPSRLAGRAADVARMAGEGVGTCGSAGSTRVNGMTPTPPP